MSLFSKHYKKISSISLAALLTTTILVTGCTTTQEFKPTASVIVGAQTSL